MANRTKPFGNYNKYHAKKTVVDGIQFDSKKEARRYRELKIIELVGEIDQLVLQPEYPLKIDGQLICKYRADFRYRDLKRDGSPTIVEDVKGFKTPEYLIKKKLMRAICGIEILET